MDQTITHIFKHDASKLEDTMSGGYERKTTTNGDVYLSVKQDTPPVKPSNQMCKPTQYKVIKLNNVTS